MKPISPRNGNLLAPFDTDERLIPAFPIYEKLTPDLLGELNRNGGWHLVLGEGGKAEATVGGGQLRTSIVDGGTIWYAVQVSFIPLPLERGREYSVHFKVRADRPQPMILDIAQVGTWYSYSSRLEYSVTPTWQEFSPTFSMGLTESEPNARFEFNLGGCGTNEVIFEYVTVLKN